jgi:hypothetical protein
MESVLVLVRVLGLGSGVLFRVRVNRGRILVMGISPVVKLRNPNKNSQ